MPLNKNGELNKEFIDTLKLQSNIDNPVLVIRQEGVPVYNISPKYATYVKSTSTTATGTTTIQPDTSKDFYITSLSAAYVKDAACDSATGAYSVGVLINGTYQYVFALPITTLTAQQGNAVISFPYPIKLDRGGTIAITGSFTVGTLTRYLNVTGFYI